MAVVVDEAALGGFDARPGGPALAAAVEWVDPSTLIGQDTAAWMRGAFRVRNHADWLLLRALREACRARADTTVRVADEFAPMIAAANLGWSTTTAATRLELAVGILERMPALGERMRAGELELAKAAAFVTGLDGLTDAQCAQVVAGLLDQAPELPLGQLRERILSAGYAVDRVWGANRLAAATARARVTRETAPCGAVNVCGRDLDPELAADAAARLRALALAVRARLRATGHKIPLGFIEARVFIRLMDGTQAGAIDTEVIAAVTAELMNSAGPNPDPNNPDPDDPSPDDGGPHDDDGPDFGGPDDSGPRDDGGPDDSGPDDSGPDESDHGGPDAGGPGDDGGSPHDDGPEDDGRDSGGEDDEHSGIAPRDEPDHGRRADRRPAEGRADDAHCAHASDGATADGPSDEPDDADPDASAGSDRPASTDLTPAARGPATGAGHLGERSVAFAPGVALRMPLSTLLGLDDQPGTLPGTGPVPAATARTAARGYGAATWQLLIHDHQGHLQHLLVLRGPPGTHPDPRHRRQSVQLTAPTELLHALTAPRDTDPAETRLPGSRSVLLDEPTTTWLRHARDALVRSETADPDQHPATTTRDRDRRVPGAALARWVAARDQTCIAPGCHRPAEACDLDHTLDWNHGGPTEAGDLDLLCRHDHRAKHEGGWHYQQPTPGVFVITDPTGTRHHIESRVVHPLPAPCHPGHGISPDPGQPRPRPDWAPNPTRDGRLTKEARATTEHLTRRARKQKGQPPSRYDTDPDF